MVGGGPLRGTATIDPLIPPGQLSFDGGLRDAVLGEGHFLGAPQTMAAMERDYFYPPLADRDPPITWAERGAPDIRASAREKARAILADHRPQYLDPAAERAIRARYNILSPEG